MVVPKREPEEETQKLQNVVLSISYKSEYTELKSKYCSLVNQYNKEKLSSLNKDDTIKDLESQLQAQAKMIEKLQKTNDNLIYCLNKNVAQIQQNSFKQANEAVPEAKIQNDPQPDVKVINLSSVKEEPESFQKKIQLIQPEVSGQPEAEIGEDTENEMVDLIFNWIQVEEPEMRASMVYWEEIANQLKMVTNYRWPAAVLKEHFRDALLPRLHERTELTNSEHRLIAVELYTLFYEPEMVKGHIDLFDRRESLPETAGNEYDQEQSDYKMEEELPLQESIMKTPHHRNLFSDEEDNCLIDYIFNFRSEMKILKDLKRNSFWLGASQAVFKIDGNDRNINSLKSRLKGILVETLHRRKELTTEKHRRIAKLCYEYSFKNDRGKGDEYMAMYDRAREN